MGPDIGRPEFAYLAFENAQKPVFDEKVSAESNTASSMQERHFIEFCCQFGIE